MLEIVSFVAALAVGLLAAVTTTAVLLRRAPKEVPGVHRSDRFGTAFVAGGAVLVGILSLGSGIGTVISALTPGPTTIAGMERNEPAPDEALEAFPRIDEAVSSYVDVTMTHAPASVIGWQLTAELLPILLTVIVSASALWLAIGMLQGRPFAKRFPVALVIVAGAVMVCGVFSQLAAAIARAEANMFIDQAADMPFALFSMQVDLAPFGWALVIGLVAGAFQIGTRMQHDTKGLV
ncbi:hypothetical protein [uncultured Microbacterium sp.]|uniref:hypothetical protein n=1 Tax=uncultured Microbacterium sp. TaxID=191216 RepID=UPI00260C2A00|nr:hypothetical protein [uncultured Microbacterium sp.]